MTRPRFDKAHKIYKGMPALRCLSGIRDIFLEPMVSNVGE